MNAPRISLVHQRRDEQVGDLFEFYWRDRIISHDEARKLRQALGFLANDSRRLDAAIEIAVTTLRRGPQSEHRRRQLMEWEEDLEDFNNDAA